jgi:hypothetical protein
LTENDIKENSENSENPWHLNKKVL